MTVPDSLRRTLIAAGLAAFLLVSASCSADNGDESAAEQDQQNESGGKAGEAGLTFPDPTVRYLQQALDDLGYSPGAVDGRLGEGTTDAVRAFQNANSLAATGSVDAETLKVMAQRSESARIAVVEGLQTALAELGFYTDVIDGLPGPNSIAALTAFQADQGLGETGELDEDTFAKLIATYDEQVTQAHIAAIEANGHGGGAPQAPTEVPDDAAPGEYLQQGDEGEDVLELQQRLAELGYRPGSVDGAFGAATASAVLAFQKREGLQRDSIVGPEVQARLVSPMGAGPRSTEAGPRVEVDLDRQIMFAVDGAGNVTIVNVSTGSGRQYQSAEAGKGIVTAHTPTGDFIVQRRIDGNRQAPLGTLYRPLYFDGGWAIHGNPYVPGYPASHGCVRTANEDQDFIFDLVADGDAVWIYGKNPPLPADADAGF